MEFEYANIFFQCYCIHLLAKYNFVPESVWANYCIAT